MPTVIGVKPSPSACPYTLRQVPAGVRTATTAPGVAACPKAFSAAASRTAARFADSGSVSEVSPAGRAITAAMSVTHDEAGALVAGLADEVAGVGPAAQPAAASRVITTVATTGARRTDGVVEQRMRATIAPFSGVLEW